MTGKIDVITDRDFYSTTVGIRESEGCVLHGDVISKKRYMDGGWLENGDVCAMDTCIDCTVNGNILGSGVGIHKSKNCTLNGSISGNGNYASGIEDGCANCTINGDISGSYSAMWGIVGSGWAYINVSYGGQMRNYNCHINGNLCNFRGIANGILSSDSCSISGDITSYTEVCPILTVNSTIRYKIACECDNCGTGSVFNHLITNSDGSFDRWADYGIHRCNYIPEEDRVIYGNFRPIIDDRGAVWSFYIFDDPENSKPNPYITYDPEAPAEQNVSYTMQVIDEVSREALPGAEIIIGGSSYTTDQNGVITVTDGSRASTALRIEYGGAVIYTDAEFAPNTNAMNIIRVTPIYLDPDDFNIGNGGSWRLDGPYVSIQGNEVPIFDIPFDFDTSVLDAVRVAYDRENDVFRVLIGNSEGLANIDNEYDTDFIEEYNEIYDLYEDIITGRYTSDDFRLHNIGRNTGMDTDISGFIELRAANGNLEVVKGGLIAGISIEAEGVTPLPETPFIYLTYSVTGEIESGLSFTLTNADMLNPQFDVDGKTEFSLSPSVGVGIGLRHIVAAETGLSGNISGTLTIPVNLLQESLELGFTGDYYLLLQILGREFTYSRQFINYEFYPRAGWRLMSVNDEKDFKPVGRNYLNENNISLMASDVDTIKRGLYTYSCVQSAKLSDGREIMVWTDDDTARSDLNRTALYYSILDNGIWSDIKQINNDGTADYDFEVKAYGNKAAVVWQNAKSTLSEDTSLDDTAHSIELSYSEFDGTGWSEPLQITNGNSSYEYNPSLYYDGGKGYVMWVQNNENKALPSAEVEESIFKVIVEGSTVSEKETVIEHTSYIDEAAIGADGICAYVIEDNGIDVLYVNERVCHTSDNSLKGLHYTDDSFCFTENGTLRKSDGLGSYSPSVCELADSDGIRLIVNEETGNKAAVYEVQNGFTSNLYASYYENDEWTNPIPMTEFTEKLRSWSALLESNGDISLSAVLASVNLEDGNTVSQTVRLVHSESEPIETVKVLYFDTDNLVRGIESEFSIGVVNGTKSSELNVTVTGEKCGELYNGTAEANNGLITVGVPIPDNFEKQNVTVSVSAVENNQSLDENSITKTVGYADIAVSLNGNRFYKNGAIGVSVENIGCDTAENIVLNLKDTQDNQITEMNINKLDPGEKQRYNIEVEDKYIVNGNTIIAQVKTDTEEKTQINNSDYYIIERQNAKAISLAEKSVGIQKGATYAPTIVFYPLTAQSTIYAVSDNTDVATVDANGTVTAVTDGKATITYITPGAELPARLEVYVRENGMPEITSAVYSGDESVGTVSVVVDTSECLISGETPLMLVAAYDEGGALIGVNTQSVSAAEDNSASVTTRGKKPKKVKIMLWNSLTNMQPAANVAERNITSQEQ